MQDYETAEPREEENATEAAKIPPGPLIAAEEYAALNNILHGCKTKLWNLVQQRLPGPEIIGESVDKNLRPLLDKDVILSIQLIHFEDLIRAALLYNIGSTSSILENNLAIEMGLRSRHTRQIVILTGKDPEVMELTYYCFTLNVEGTKRQCIMLGLDGITNAPGEHDVSAAYAVFPHVAKGELERPAGRVRMLIGQYHADLLPSSTPEDCVDCLRFWSTRFGSGRVLTGFHPAFKFANQVKNDQVNNLLQATFTPVSSQQFPNFYEAEARKKNLVMDTHIMIAKSRVCPKFDMATPGSELSDLIVATRIDDKILDALHSRPIRFIIMITPRSELSGQIIANRVAVKILDGLHSRPVGDTIMGAQIVVAGKIEVARMSMVEQSYLHGIVRNVKVISLPKRARNGARKYTPSAVFFSSLSRYRSTCPPPTRSFTSVKTASGSPRSSNQAASPWSPIPLLLPAPLFPLTPEQISLNHINMMAHHPDKVEHRPEFLCWEGDMREMAQSCADESKDV